MNPTHLVSALTGIGPDVLALLGALGTLGVALQAVLMVVGRWLPVAARGARIMGVVVTDLGKLAEIGKGIGKAGKISAASLVLFATSCGCTPAERATIARSVPTLTQVQSVASVLEHACTLAELAGADVAKARAAIASKDPYAAVGALRDALDIAAKAGHPVPSEVVALANVAEGALAAQAVAEGMRALSGDAGAP